MSEEIELREAAEEVAKTGGSIYASTAKFDLTQRAAKMFAASSVVPKEYQGNIANCAIAINISERLHADAFQIMQSMHVIHGRPSWSATFLIAMVNSSGRFTPLQFEIQGKGNSLSCRAYANNKETQERVEGPLVTMEMAKAEGWADKAGSNGKTMPEVMIRYRAASFFAKLYAPDITLGMQTTEEVNDFSVGRGFKKARSVSSNAVIPKVGQLPYNEQVREDEELPEADFSFSSETLKLEDET